MSVTLAGAYDDVVDVLDAELREAVRRDGVDPQREADLVRALAVRLVADHNQRSLTGAVAPVADEQDVVEELVARVAGFGPLQRYLDDPTVEEIWIISPVNALAQVSGRLEGSSPQRVRSRKSLRGK